MTTSVPEKGSVQIDAAYVAARINQGASREMIIQELVGQGLPQADVEAQVNLLFAALMAQAKNETVTTGSVIGAIIAGGIAAAICAALWIALIYATERELGLAALGLGALVALSVRLASGNRRGQTFQFISAGCAFLGVALAKGILLSMAFLAKDTLKQDPFAATFSPYDILWIILAVGTAWNMLKGTGIQMSGPAQSLQK